ncbi:MAG: glycosyl transferase involved in lipopolysaccharide synthesis [Deltaproteobacteria bacterium]|nr:glycosyl transferase involved in lipopolysaccharide synthesis [Deltaproteobacteria bacterium]
MRLVHITTVPESLGFLKGQVAIMKANGFEITAISSPGSELAEFGTQQGVEVVAVPMSRKITPLDDLRALWTLVGHLRRLRPMIVHAHTPKAGLLGSLAGLIAGTPVRIYHLRGLPLETATGWRRTMLRWTERVTCAAAHRVISVSHSLRELAVRERLCSESKITVLAGGSGQGVDADGRFDPARVSPEVRAAKRRAYQIPDDAFVIGFFGRLVRDKGILELLDAWRQLSAAHPNIHLLIAGGAEERDALPDQALAALREDPRIHWIGWDWETPPLFAAVDVVVVPTYREGFPNVPLEAAAMRKPVVGTRVTGCIDAIEDGTTGLLVPARDASALAAAIERYIEDPRLAERHGAAGRDRVRSSFRRELIWDALHATYRELIRQAHARASAVTRILDVVGAGTILATAAVPLAALSAAVAINMGRPILFSHERPGLGERPFRMYKFRTMTDRRGPGGELLPDRDRITPLGAFMRRTSLDELPELFNVLRGEMSLVGPRPLLMRYLPFYSPAERHRHDVRPGVTGWAQLHGRNQVTWDRRLALDVWYVEHRSVRLYLEILLSTLALVVRREGVVVDPTSIMRDLDQERRASPATRPA